MSSGPKLSIVVVGAKGLRGVDWGKTSDPYCVLRPVGDGEVKVCSWAVGDCPFLPCFPLVCCENDGNRPDLDAGTRSDWHAASQ